MQNSHPSKSSKARAKPNKRQRNRRRNKQRSQNTVHNRGPSNFTHSPTSAAAVPRTEGSSGADIWRGAYENAVRWHGEHQASFWRGLAKDLQKENQMLRQQLNSRLVDQVLYETSDEDEGGSETLEAEELEENVDGEYLEFLSVTIKHREELRLKRENEE